MSRGFTLMETMITVSILGVVSAASFAFYEETRVAAAATESRRALGREAALAVEIVGRALRGAEKIEADGATYRLRGGEGEALGTIALAPEGLVVETEGRMVIAGVKKATIAPVEGGHRVVLELAPRSPLIAKRAKIVRSFFVGRRL